MTERCKDGEHYYSDTPICVHCGDDPDGWNPKTKLKNQIAALQAEKVEIIGTLQELAIDWQNLLAKCKELEKENSELKTDMGMVLMFDKIKAEGVAEGRKEAYEDAIRIIIDESVSISPTYLINAIRAKMGGE